MIWSTRTKTKTATTATTTDAADSVWLLLLRVGQLAVFGLQLSLWRWFSFHWLLLYRTPLAHRIGHWRVNTNSERQGNDDDHDDGDDNCIDFMKGVCCAECVPRTSYTSTSKWTRQRGKGRTATEFNWICEIRCTLTSIDVDCAPKTRIKVTHSDAKVSCTL